MRLHRRLTLRHAAIAAMLTALPAAACRTRDRDDAARPALPSPAAPRRFLAERPETLWTTTFADTEFQGPSFMASDAERVYITDPADRTVHAFDVQTGARRWRRQPLGGHPRALTGLRRGGVAFIDDETGAIGMHHAMGRLGPSIAAAAVRNAGSVCELSDGSFLLSTVNGGAQLAIVERPAHVRRAVSLPWSDLHQGLTAQT